MGKGNSRAAKPPPDASRNAATPPRYCAAWPCVKPPIPAARLRGAPGKHPRQRQQPATNAPGSQCTKAPATVSAAAAAPPAPGSNWRWRKPFLPSFPPPAAGAFQTANRLRSGPVPPALPSSRGSQPPPRPPPAAPVFMPGFGKSSPPGRLLKQQLHRAGPGQAGQQFPPGAPLAGLRTAPYPPFFA